MTDRSIHVDEEVLERLRRYKRDDERFSAAIDRLLDDVEDDWRDVFGSWSGARGTRLAATIEQERGLVDDYW